jgi:hypothetical protein
MKRMALVLLLGAWLAHPAFAQGQGELGAYVDYLRLEQTDTNMAGIGGRLSVSTSRFVQLEAEMSYDFEEAFTEGFTNTSTGTVTLQRTNVRLLHGLFGPKLHTPGPIQAFVTIKGGFINFRMDPRPATVATFTSSVESLRANDVSGVLYPGAGLESHMGFFGVRLDVGDEIYFNQGTHHNLRVAFGPIFRF